MAQIAGVLRRVADAEGIEIGDEAVALIARSATGSFRDALGTLEQLLAYSGASIALEDVLAVLGAADADLVFSTVDAVASGNARDALLAAARLSDSGRDVGRFFGDLEAHARGLMIVQVLRGEVPPELQVTAEQDARLVEQARRVAPADVVRLLDLLAAGLRAMKDGSDARTQLELALVKAATPALEPSVKALLARVERLEAGRPSPPPDGAPVRTPEAPATAAGRAGSGPGRTSVAVSAQVGDQPAVATSTTVPGTPPHPDGAAAAALAGRAAQRVSSELATDADPSPAVAAVAVMDPQAETPEAVSVEHGVDLDLDGFASLWPAVIDSVGSENRLLAASLAEARPATLADRELTLAVGAVGRVLQAHGRGRRQQGAHRPGDPGRDGLLAAPGLRAAHGRRARVRRRGLALRSRPLRGRAHRPPGAGVRRRGASPRPATDGASLMPQPNMQQMMKQVQKMQADMMKAQESLKDDRIDASAGGGMVKVVITGDLVLQSIEIDPDAVDPEDVEMLQDMVLAATNEAIRSAQEHAAAKMGGLAGGLGGLGLPGM